MTWPFNFTGNRDYLRSAVFTSERDLLRTIKLITIRIEHCCQFYPWPALVDSWREDVALLQSRLREIRPSDLTHSMIDGRMTSLRSAANRR